jgi:purine-nucleoside phosphorylase
MNDYLSQVREAANYIRRAMKLPILAEEKSGLAIVLGSGLGEFAESLTQKRRIPYTGIPHFPRTTVRGHAGSLVLGRLQDHPIFCLQGRVHYYEGHHISRVTFPVRVLGDMGIKTLILTNAAGGLNPRFHTGDLMLIKDHLSPFIPNPLIGPKEDTVGPLFPDMSQCYSSKLRNLARKCARALRLHLCEGVYLAVTGPSYETPAEIRMFRKLGADAVGMSTVPEVIVARQIGMECLGISVITNMAVRMSQVPLSHEEVLREARRVKAVLMRLLNSICRELLAGSGLR